MMNGLLYSTYLQWKMDFRNKGVLITYYIVPLVFYLVMGSVFTGINPSAKHSLIQSMTIFAVSMGAFIGTPVPLTELLSSDIKKSYLAGGIPLWIIPLTNFLSAFVHLFMVSVIIYASAPFVFKADVPTHPVIYFFLLFLVIAVSVEIGLLIGLTAKKASAATMLSQLVFLPSLLLSGIMFPSALLPSIFKKAGSIFPASHSMKMLTAQTGQFLARTVPLLIIGLIMIILLVFAYNYAARE